MSFKRTVTLTWHYFSEDTPREEWKIFVKKRDDDDASMFPGWVHDGKLVSRDYINKNRHIYCGYWAYVDDQPYTYQSNIKLTCQRCPICGKEDSLKPIISNLAGDVKSRIDPATGKSVYYKRCNNCGFRTVHDALFVERNGIL